MKEACKFKTRSSISKCIHSRGEPSGRKRELKEFCYHGNLSGDGHSEAHPGCLFGECGNNCIVVNMKDYMIALPKVTPAKDSLQDCIDLLELNVTELKTVWHP